MENKKRTFVIDFNCCRPYGHNLQVVNLYRRKEEKRGRTAIAIVCRRVKSFKNIDQENFYFLLPTIYLMTIAETLKKKILRKIFIIMKGLLLIPLGKINTLDLKAIIGARRLFKKCKFHKDDLVIFPSVDYYGVSAFLKELSKIKVENRPRVHLRFIGVLESTYCIFKDSFSELIDLVNKNHQTLSVSGEAPIYARYLDSLIPEIDVIAEPFPIDEAKQINSVEKVNNNSFNVLFPGTNRADKGYFEIFNLAKELLFVLPNLKLIVQDMKAWDEHFNKKYQQKLKRLVNVELVDSVLSRKELEALYKSANLILLPYSPNTYHFRGSGIHYEALEYHIPVLAKKGVGFAEEIVKWSSGWTYETKQELFACLKKITNMDSISMNQKMDNAFLNYKKSSDEAYCFNLS